MNFLKNRLKDCGWEGRKETYLNLVEHLYVNNLDASCFDATLIVFGDSVDRVRFVCKQAETISNMEVVAVCADKYINLPQPFLRNQSALIKVQEQTSLSQAFNIGSALARSSLLIFINDRCHEFVSAADEHLFFHKNNEVDILFGPIINSSTKEYITTRDINYNYTQPLFPEQPFNFSTKKNLHHSLGGFDETIFNSMFAAKFAYELYKRSGEVLNQFYSPSCGLYVSDSYFEYLSKQMLLDQVKLRVSCSAEKEFLYFINSDYKERNDSAVQETFKKELGYMLGDSDN